MTRPRLTCLKPPLAPAPVNGWKPDAIRGSRHQRGYGSEWERARKRIIERDLGLCQECLRQGRTSVGEQVDHITPKAQGGGDNEANLQLLCGACHRTKTARESQGGEGVAKNAFPD